jgi:hypothetical protein
MAEVDLNFIASHLPSRERESGQGFNYWLVIGLRSRAQPLVQKRN